MVSEEAEELNTVIEEKPQDVLVEEVNHQDPSLVSGRMSNNTVVHFKGDASMIGTIVPVHLQTCKSFYYMGEMVSDK